MRISDWSSDVCSSDLVGDPVDAGAVAAAGEHDEGEVVGEPWVRLVPAGQLDGAGVDGLHVVDRGTEVAGAATTAEHMDLRHAPDPAVLPAVLGVGDDAADPAPPHLELARTAGPPTPSDRPAA